MEKKLQSVQEEISRLYFIMYNADIVRNIREIDTERVLFICRDVEIWKGESAKKTTKKNGLLLLKKLL